METVRVLGPERQRRVLGALRARGVVHVRDLADAVGVSTSTIRRDLKELDEQGLLHRVHGGASLPDPVEVAPVARRSEHRGEKARIGAAAAETVRDHSTILITGGTTTEEMLPHLATRAGLTVVTNSLTVATVLAAYPTVTVVVLGGILRPAELSLLGPLTEAAMTDFEVDAAYTGAYGVDTEGLTGASVHEATTDRRLLGSARCLVVLADSSKFAQRGPVRMARVSQVDRLVTDTGAPATDVAAFRAAGVDVTLV